MGSPFFMKQNETRLICSDFISNLMVFLLTGACVFPYVVRANRLFFWGEGYRVTGKSPADLYPVTAMQSYQKFNPLVMTVLKGNL